MIDKQVLNKKLAEWAGFKWDGSGWHYPHIGEKSQVVYCPDLPNFTNSLDACFKWLVPKLTRYEIWCDTAWKEGEVLHGDKHFSLVQIGTHTGVAEAETPALALCLAIEKVIDGTS